MNYPALRLDVDRIHAAELGLTQKDVVDNVITALNSNYMIAPNYWVDRKSGNDYYLTVQYLSMGPARFRTWWTSARYLSAVRRRMTPVPWAAAPPCRIGLPLVLRQSRILRRPRGRALRVFPVQN